ncbi:CLUMA_CG019224, isoform A [Clunio marinus]|uniref:CLUMA_CG019224, isoform A n=1 Tax=Clunio marinus TaxID=568069 RepID=A0A1J1J1Y1_9DIPT|nr:CLUMA_CG019224, isoform A [Clunio marinus]
MRTKLPITNNSQVPSLIKGQELSKYLDGLMMAVKTFVLHLRALWNEMIGLTLIYRNELIAEALLNTLKRYSRVKHKSILKLNSIYSLRL